MKPTVHDLIYRVKLGDKIAFREMLILYEHKVYHFCLKLIKDKHHAEDITQETFIAVYQNIHHYDVSKPFSTWLFAIAKHKAYRFAKQTSKSSQNQDFETLILADNTSNIEEKVTLHESHQELLDAIDLLKNQQKEAIFMKYFTDMTYKDIAIKMRISEKKVENLIYAAKKKLHHQLTKHDERMVSLNEY